MELAKNGVEVVELLLGGVKVDNVELEGLEVPDVASVLDDTLRAEPERDDKHAKCVNFKTSRTRG